MTPTEISIALCSFSIGVNVTMIVIFLARRK